MSEKEKLLDEVEKEINEYAQPYSCIVEKEGQLVEKEVWAVGVIEDIIKQFKKKIKKEESKKSFVLITRQQGKVKKMTVSEFQNAKAIEELEKAKVNMRQQICLMNNDEHCYPQYAICWQNVVAIINHQIKELKGETDGSNN